jgi:alpha-tubulin suppressor-like RCC1 family protein
LITKDESSEKRQFLTTEVEPLLDTIPSLPFSLDFSIPVVKVVCGDLFMGLLTSQGQVFTWGTNHYGQLGLKDEKLGVVLEPTRVQFTNDHRIVDLVCNQNSCMALNDNHGVYLWGRRMGMYPPIELTLNGIEAGGRHLLQEHNQAEPRLHKSNLIFYKVTSLRAGGQNCALLTESGELLIHGMNYQGQLGIGKDLGKHLIFFADFMKVDFFLGKPVLDIAFGAMHTLVLCRDKETGKNRVFGCGSTKEG